ncbi:metallophosphoesterase family protein [Clostridium botulinum]|uniref:metallophosphoesterase family protein n=1 Tax=Clostridium botulinum TaxID=1491 RepID=UPI00131C0A5D|nr:metallophosphoesterase [Clostridium botulinum]
MESRSTFRDREILIKGISTYYSVEDIKSLARLLDISEAEYFNAYISSNELADKFVTRVFQLSKENQLLETIKDNEDLKRPNIIKNISTDIINGDNNENEDESFNSLKILHLSDIHLGTSAEASKYKLQLKTDLISRLKVEKIDFLILSGDITNASTFDEYDAAFKFIEDIIKSFKIDRSKIIIVPGNHDLSWDVCKRALIKEDEFNKEIYKLRFDNFSNYFYSKLCGQDYPTEYEKQGILYKYEEEKIIVLGLNSAWEIDHIKKLRASINMESMSESIGNIIMDKKYNDWLKIAVFHHSVTGKDSMDNGFLELLVSNNFKVCMHGHIHEAKYDFYSYGNNREIAIIGAGTFGAPAEEHVLGVPLQYNFIELSLDNKQIKVNTRRREKVDGAWEADARWGDKDNPKPFYKIDLSKINNI